MWTAEKSSGIGSSSSAAIGSRRFSRDRPATRRRESHRSLQSHRPARPHRLPRPHDRRPDRCRRPAAAAAIRRPGGLQRRPECPEHPDGRVYHRSGCGHLPRAGGRSTPGRDQRRHRARTPHVGGGRVRHGDERRGRADRRGAGCHHPRGLPVRRGQHGRRGPDPGPRDPQRRRRLHQADGDGRGAHPGDQTGRVRVHRGADPRRCGAGSRVRHLRDGPRARGGRDQARRAGRSPVDRARVAHPRRGYRPHEAARRLAGGRHLQWGLHRQRGQGTRLGGRDPERTRRPPRPSAPDSGKL